MDYYIYPMSNGTLCHHGIKGMKWGIRRYQNKDGSLTPAGQKRVEKDYRKTSNKVTEKLKRNYQNMYIDSYNKTADYFNSGGIEKFNNQQRKKYGEKFSERDGYVNDYNKLFDKHFAKNFNKSLNEFYNTDVDVKKARDLVKKYDMTTWNEFAKTNEAMIEEVRSAVEKGK